ncbi:MAG TPA: hypothetical protein VK348_03810 [Planctomycetota bacterium]|nr:hypothetical protein [Planctomycetota bacterium]
MPRPIAQLVLIALTTSMVAQSPLTTTFTGASLGGAGGAIYFDITVNSTVTVTGLDLNDNMFSGFPGGLRVWTCPTTRIGQQTNRSAWTLVATGACTSRGVGMPTPVLLSSFVLPAGSHGMALEGDDFFGNACTPANGTNQTCANADMAISCGEVAWPPFTTLLPGQQVVNMNLYYSLGERYGHGCYDASASFYELFADNFDLGGNATGTSSIRLHYTGSSYQVGRGSNAFFVPVSQNMALRQRVELPLPFALPYPGGTTSILLMDFRGVISPVFGNSYQTLPGVPAALAGEPRWMVCWRDIDPSPGTTNFDVDPAGNAVYCSWIGVPNSQGTIANTFQAAFFANGDVEYRWRGMDPAGTTLVGWTPAHFALDPGGRDISATMPFVTAATDRPALAIGIGARLVLGSAPNLVLSSLPAGCTMAAAILSFVQRDPGIDLAGLGMPGCAQYVGFDVVRILPIRGDTASQPLPIPNVQSLVGLRLFAQGVAVAPGQNALGVVTAHGLQLVIDHP